MLVPFRLRCEGGIDVILRDSDMQLAGAGFPVPMRPHFAGNL